MIQTYLNYTGRIALIATAVECRGEWDEIYRRLRDKKSPSPEEAERLLATIQCKVTTVLDPDYPAVLRERCPKPPFVLFYYGDIKLARDSNQILTVVGARVCTDYAYQKTKYLVREIADRGYIVATGLARGIDTAAAEVTSEMPKKTIGVLGCGIERMYPLENEALRDRIAYNGLLLSEYPGDVEPMAKHFPVRNRILAALGRGIFVGEAHSHSGTLITIAYAMSMNRDVAALPFRCDEEEIVNNQMIKTGAALIESPEDLELFLNTAAIVS